MDDSQDAMVSHILYDTLYNKADKTSQFTPIVHHNLQSNICLHAIDEEVVHVSKMVNETTE